MVGAAGLKCDEPAAEASEFIRRQLSDGDGDFFDLHVRQYSTAGAINAVGLAALFRRRIFMTMTGFAPTAGYLVVVTTQRLGSGKPLRAPFVVAEPDPIKAKDLVRAVLAPDETVKLVCPLSAESLKLFGLQTGQFTNPW
jgi:hypothetical protein